MLLAHTISSWLASRTVCAERTQPSQLLCAHIEPCITHVLCVLPSCLAHYYELLLNFVFAVAFPLAT